MSVRIKKFRHYEIDGSFSFNCNFKQEIQSYTSNIKRMKNSRSPKLNNFQKDTLILEKGRRKILGYEYH